MANNTKGYTLDKGFLFDKSWAKPMRNLSPQDFHTIFWELYDFQDSKGVKLIPPHQDNPMLDTYTDLITPQIINRLNGQRGGQIASNIDSNIQNSMGSIGGSIGGSTLKISKDKINKDKMREDNSEEQKYIDEFEKLWEKYPIKQGKDRARLSYIENRKSGTTYEEVDNGLDDYIKQIKTLKTKPEYIKHGSTWFCQSAWKDDYKTNETNDKNSSFDTNDFFQLALKKSYENTDIDKTNL